MHSRTLSWEDDRWDLWQNTLRWWHTRGATDDLPPLKPPLQSWFPNENIISNEIFTACRIVVGFAGVFLLMGFMVAGGWPEVVEKVLKTLHETFLVDPFKKFPFTRRWQTKINKFKYDSFYFPFSIALIVLRPLASFFKWRLKPIYLLFGVGERKYFWAEMRMEKCGRERDTNGNLNQKLENLNVKQETWNWTENYGFC